jgi:hypothetical protein
VDLYIHSPIRLHGVVRARWPHLRLFTAESLGQSLVTPSEVRGVPSGAAEGAIARSKQNSIISSVASSLRRRSADSGLPASNCGIIELQGVWQNRLLPKFMYAWY